MQKTAVEKSNDPIAAQLAPVGRETVQDRVYLELRRALIGACSGRAAVPPFAVSPMR